MKSLLEKRSSEKGQSTLESLLCTIIIFIILIGLLQIYHLGVARLLTGYSAFRTARSYCVGFADYLVDRSSRVAAIGASGKIVEPNSEEFDSPLSQFAGERMMIPEYLSGERWLDYEYWHGENEYSEELGYYNFDSDVESPSTTISNTNSELVSGTISSSVAFSSYPFPFLDLFDKNRILFESVGQSVDISGESVLANHSADYLQETAGGGGAGP